MKPLIFKKSYTRDTTMIIQQIWAKELSAGVERRRGWKNPFLPFIVHFMINGTVEIWDNEKAIEWFSGKLLEQNLRSREEISVTLNRYKEQLKKVKLFWEKGAAKTEEEFQSFLELLPQLMFDFNDWYYSVTHKDTPKDLVNEILEIRKDDTFFASTDTFISKTLRELHPEVSGYENLILLNEVKQIPGVEILKERMKGAAIIDGNEYFLGDHVGFALRYPNLFLEQEKVEQVQLVKGQVAFKGLVSGPVRILRRRAEVQDVGVGDILVSPMTTPDFMPAMEKAAAFVTDEGGITCHAAIVAREMKKPCVIGTKIATQVFKDGDLVEVDAERGIVKKI